MKANNNDQPKKIDITGILADISLVGLVYVVAQIVVAMMIVGFGIKDSSELAKRPQLVLNSYIFAGLITLFLTYGVLKLRKVDFSSLGFRKYMPTDFGYALLGYVVYMFIAVLATSILRLIPGLDLDQTQDLGLGEVSKGLLPLAFVALVFVPPIVEEILFRGFLYGRLKHHRLPLITAAILTSVGFGLVHGQLNVGVDTFILSMVMIFMLEKRKNLWVTVTMHALKNFVAFLALFVFKIV